MSTQSMSPAQIALVRDSWHRLLPLRDRVAELFYRRLFEIDPSLVRLFRGDMAEQGAKLTAMLGTVVGRLDRLAEIVPAVERLGRRHAEYGVEPAHYETVGAALLDTLRLGLGDGWSPQVGEAWALAYATLADVMLRASYGGLPAPFSTPTGCAETGGSCASSSASSTSPS